MKTNYMLQLDAGPLDEASLAHVLRGVLAALLFMGYMSPKPCPLCSWTRARWTRRAWRTCCAACWRRFCLWVI